MSNNEFIENCKKIIVEYVNSNMNDIDFTINKDDVYVVWLCKTLQNHKALLITNVGDNRYYELTYNGDKQELYTDVYKKEENFKKTLNELQDLQNKVENIDA